MTVTPSINTRAPATPAILLDQEALGALNLERVRALIFDVDGTLAETEEAHRAAFNRAFAEAGLDWRWSRDLYRMLLKTTGGKERIAAFQQDRALRLRPDEIAELHRRKTAIYAGMLASGGIIPRPGAQKLLDRARAAGLRVAIATTTSRANVDALCRCCWGADTEALFEVVAAGDEVAAKKPAPDVFLLALERLDLPAGDCIAVEDSLNGLRAALSAGLRVAVSPGAYTEDEFA